MISELLLSCLSFIFYLKGIGIERNLSNAVSYLQIAADFNYVPSFVIYGLFLLNGIFTDKNEKKAIELIKRASDCFDPLGDLYYGKLMIESKGRSKFSYDVYSRVRRSSESNVLLSFIYLSVIEPRRRQFL
jgi:TPR repeat protein